MAKFPVFVKECAAELRKVQWPTRDDVVASVKVVIVSTILIAALLGGLDLIYTVAMRFVFNR